MPRLRSPRALATACALVTALVGATPNVSAAQPVRNPANGHYYELVTVPNRIDWFGADAAANARTFMGATGHLATITSAAENVFISNAFGSVLDRRWLGGFQAVGAAEPAGGWAWVTGEAWAFTRWGTFEPNNAFRTEDRLAFGGPGNANGRDWNDLTGTSRELGYVVEYAVTAAPEPAAVLLLGAGLLAIGGTAAYRRR